MAEVPIRVLIVDDTVTYRRIISNVLAGIPGVEIVGTASNGKIALEKIKRLKPDILTLDLEMPVMDGLEVLRQLKSAGSEVGAIVLSTFTTEGAKSTMTALSLGAFDFVLKPTGGTPEENMETLRDELRLKIKNFDRTRQIHKILHGKGIHTPSRTSAPPAAQKKSGPAERMHRIAATKTPKVVALGISTGGPKSLTRMLPNLPGSLAVPVLIVQHMPPIFTKSMANDLDNRCALSVCEAADGQLVEPGNVYIAPGGKQMKIEWEDGTTLIRITDDPPENSCRPSVDYLFRSVAEIYGARALGVIMTGMGSDGSKGCRQMKQRGASIIAQDEATCVVFGMPREPIEQGIADVVAPLDGIAAEITRLVGKGVLACR